MTDERISMLLQKYKEYSVSDEGYAVLRVKQNMKEETKGFWVWIHDNDYPLISEDGKFFKKIECELFPRTQRPKYPKQGNLSDDEFYSICRAITWEVSHDDMQKQINKGYKGAIYKLTFDIIKRKKRFKDNAPDWVKKAGKYDDFVFHDGKKVYLRKWEIPLYTQVLKKITKKR